MKVIALFCNTEVSPIELLPSESMRANLEILYRAASSVDRSAVVLDIFGPSYWWLVAESDQEKPLSAWLTGKETEDVTVTVCARRRFPLPTPSSTVSTVDMLFAKERLQTSLAWQPCMAPEQTSFGISQFLGALYMIDAVCNEKEQARLAVYVATRLPIASQRVPFLYSLYALWVTKERPSFAMQSLIANGLFSIFSTRIQQKQLEKNKEIAKQQSFDAKKVFEHALELWTDLLKEASTFYDDNLDVKALFLEPAFLSCALTHSRLENPVRTVPLGSTNSNDTVASATASAAATNDESKENEKKPDEKKMAARVYSAAAVAIRQPGGSMYLPGNPFANCTVVPDVEYAAYLLAQPFGTFLCRVNAQTASSFLSAPAAAASAASANSPVSANVLLSAPEEKTKKEQQQQQQQLFKVYHPLALRGLQPPCLTWIAPKTVGAYEAQGKGSQTDVFIHNFATSSRDQHDPDDLADTVDIGQYQESGDEGAGSAVPIGEAVIVLLDVSGSMSKAFTKESAEKNDEKEEEEQEQEDTDNVTDLAEDPKDEAALARIASSDWIDVARRLFASKNVTCLLRIVAIAEPSLADLIRRRPFTLKKMMMQTRAQAQQQQKEKEKEQAASTTSEEPKKIGISVKNMSGNTLQLQVSASDRIDAIKERVANEWKLISANFRMIFAGATLKDDALVREYNLTEGVLLHAIVYNVSTENPLASSVKDGRRTIQIRYGTVKNGRSLGSVSFDGTESMAKLYLLVYESFSYALSNLKTFCFWYNMKDLGDSYQSGSTLYGAKVDMLRLDCDDILYVRSVPRSHPSRIGASADKEKERENRLDRITVAKHLFETFCDRLRSYRLPTHLGLLKFGSKVDYACPLAPAFRRFRRTSEEAKAQGDTHLYDALITACDRLVEYRNEKSKESIGGVASPAAGGNNISLRILVLSDGKDQGSSASALDAARRLWRNGVICDAVQIGSADSVSRELSVITLCTGGYTFTPQTASEAVYPFELETMLSSQQRVLNRSASLPSDWDIRFGSVHRQSCSRDAGAPPPRKVPVALSLSAQTVAAALERDVDTVVMTRTSTAASSSTTAASVANNAIGRDTLRQLMIQLRLLNDAPHPHIDVYPCESNLLVWRFVIGVPADTENTPYAGGTFLLYAQFPAEFPRAAPEIRFITPIRHVNVNMYGRVCHSILAENWNASRTMSEVLACIYGLLLCADVESPIDSALAQQYHVDAGVYEATIADHVRTHARSATRMDYRRRLVRESEDDDNVDEKKTIAERVRMHPRSATRAANNSRRNEVERDDEDEGGSSNSHLPLAKKQKKEDKNSQEAEENVFCVVCLAERRGILLLPCAHAVLCNACGSAWTEDCPICRKPVTNRQRIFLS